MVGFQAVGRARLIQSPMTFGLPMAGNRPPFDWDRSSNANHDVTIFVHSSPKSRSKNICRYFRKPEELSLFFVMARCRRFKEEVSSVASTFRLRSIRPPVFNESDVASWSPAVGSASTAGASGGIVTGAAGAGAARVGAAGAGAANGDAADTGPRASNGTVAGTDATECTGLDADGGLGGESADGVAIGETGVDGLGGEAANGEIGVTIGEIGVE